MDTLGQTDSGPGAGSTFLSLINVWAWNFEHAFWTYMYIYGIEGFYGAAARKSGVSLDLARVNTVPYGYEEEAVTRAKQEVAISACVV